MKKIFCVLFTGIVITNLFSQGSVLLVGGGQENYNDWSDLPYGWFVQKADSGKIINIDVSSASSWYPGYFQWLGASAGSHEMQIATGSTANDSTTYFELITAKGIFIEGGDQWPYVSTWKGTLVEDAIHYVFNHGGAIGGTSAGLAVLGDVVFDAKFGGASPDLVAYNPYNNRVSFIDDFLGLLPNVFTDSHFHDRGRLGRLVPMLARRIQDYGEANIMGVGVSINTALCVEPNLIATAYGEGVVTILYKSNESVILAEQGQAPTFTNINYHMLNHSAVFDLQSRTLVSPGQHLSALPPPSGNTPTYRDTTINGSLENSANLGEVVISNLTSGTLTAWYGNLVQGAGAGIIPETVIIPKLWNDSDYFENRFIGGFWGVATNPHFTAIYVDDNSNSTISSDGILTADGLMYILDTYDASYAGIVSSGSNYSGIIGAKLHFLGHQDGYNLATHSAITDINSGENKPPSRFNLKGNYPNPFNSSTRIEYYLPVRSTVEIAIFNIHGQLISRLYKGTQNAGDHQITWDAQHLPSGMYFYRIQTSGQSLTKKCLLLK
jgi:cyanophycinase